MWWRVCIFYISCAEIELKLVIKLMSSCSNKELVLKWCQSKWAVFFCCCFFSPPVIPESPPKMETKESSQSPKSESKSPLTSHVSSQTLLFLTDQTGSRSLSHSNIKIPLQGSAEGRKRKRRRVLKSRTFIDDEGCIGTWGWKWAENLRLIGFSIFRKHKFNVCCQHIE